MRTFKVWFDHEEDEELVVAESIDKALDFVAQNLGFVDHADYLQETEMEVSDINILEVLS